MQGCFTRQNIDWRQCKLNGVDTIGYNGRFLFIQSMQQFISMILFPDRNDLAGWASITTAEWAIGRLLSYLFI